VLAQRCGAAFDRAAALLEAEARAYDLDRPMLGLDGLQYQCGAGRDRAAPVSGMLRTRPAGTSDLANRSVQVAEVSFSIALLDDPVQRRVVWSMRLGQSAKRGIGERVLAAQHLHQALELRVGHHTASTIQPSWVLKRSPVGLRVTERLGGLAMHTAGDQMLR